MSKSYLNIFHILVLFIAFLIGPALKTASAQQRMGLETKLIPDSLALVTEFGKSVAMYGNTAIVGAQGVTNGSATYSGAAYIYQFNGNEWVQTQKLIASDVGVTGDEFGVDVDIEGDVAVVGATFNENNGSVYVFNFNGVKWVEVQKLKGQRPAIQEGFGASLALNGSALIVGTTAFSAPGYAYLFEYNGVQWIEKQLLVPSVSTIEDFFGRSVDIYKDRAVIGTGVGTAFVFHQDGDSLIERQLLEPEDDFGTNNLNFGGAVSIYGNTILIGRNLGRVNGVVNLGTAHIFEYNGNSWDETQMLVADDGVAEDRFGTSLSLNDNLLVIGSPNNRNNRGAAYIFENDGAGWVQKYKIIKGDDEANDPAAQSFFGNAVFITPKSALIGAWGTKEDDQITGASYLYEFMAQPGNATAADGESNSQVRISWQNRSNNADGFRIYRDGIEIGSTVLAATVFNDIDAIPGELYKYQVTAYNNYWEESTPSLPEWGWHKANGTIDGTVQTQEGATIKDVDIVATPVDSTLGLSLDFDGVDDHVALPITVLKNPMTISAWIKTSSANEQQILCWGNTETGHAVEFKIVDRRLVYIETDDLTGTAATSIQQVNTGNWQHVAVVVNGNSAQLYINGISEESVSNTQRNVDVNTLTIGARQTGAVFLQPFTGNIDDVQLWNRKLSAEEIIHNMFYALRGNEDSLTSYWTFNDSTRSTGKIAGDYARQGNNHGRINGAQWSNDAAPVAYRDLTDVDGNFSIPNLFYGEIRDFRVTPYKEDHLFDPQFRDIEIERADSPGISFNDTTVFTVSGQVLFAGGCPVEGVELVVDDERSEIFTDENGNFSLAFEEPGKTYTIKPLYEDSISAHQFSPQQMDVLVEGNIDGIMFADIEKHLLYGKIRGGCIAGLGTAQIRISSLKNPGCLDTTITTDINGNYRLFLPAQEYLVDLIYIDNPDSANILDYFAAETVDITWQNKNQNFVYHPKPLVQLELLPSEFTCDNVALLHQNTRYNLLIDVLEAYENDTCHVFEGFVTIYDAIGGDPDQPVTIKLENGRAIYTFNAGVPNILGGGEHPYQKLMQIKANVDGQETLVDQWGLITGHRPRTATFASTTPELPFMILRDPPGDKSYSFQGKGTTIVTRSTIQYEQARTAGAFADLRFGVVAGSPEIGATTEFGLYGILGASIQAGGGSELSRKLGLGGYDTSNVFTLALTAQEEFRTSESDLITGADADVFVGASLNQVFALTDIIDYDPESCQVIRDTSLAMDITGFNTTYIYTQDHIKNIVIPQLEQLISLSANPDSVAYFQAAIDVWREAIAENERLKREARKIRNISYSGGTEYAYSASTVKDSSFTIAYTQIVETEFVLAAGIVISSVPAESGYKLQFKMTLRETDLDSTNSQNKTIGYTLSDDDIGDYFSVDIKADNEGYGTPVFDLVAGACSCPWEPGAQPRDGVQLGINTFQQNDVPPNEPATFSLSLGNTSESGEARPYDLRVIQLSNPDGAIIKIGGVPMNDGISYYIPAGDSAYQATLTIERGPLSYDYNNLQIIMVPPCEWDLYDTPILIADTVTFSVHFASPLSNAALSFPKDNWEINPNEPNAMPIVISDYNLNNEYLKSLKLQYRQPNGSWITAFSVARDQLPEQNLRSSWNYQDLEDGLYELRAVSDGGTKGIRYSPVVKGRIERNTMLVRGTPEPADRILNMGENISVSFASGIDVDKLNAGRDIELIDAADSTKIDFTVTVLGNKLIIEPDSSFAHLGECTLLATINNLTDKEGKRLSQPLSWTFRVSQQSVFWKSLASEIKIYSGVEAVYTAILYNAASNVMDYKIDYLPGWLSLSADQVNDTIAAAAEKHLAFKLNHNKTTGLIRDSISIILDGKKESRPLTLNILAAPPPWSLENTTGGAYSAYVYVQLLLNEKLSSDDFDIAGVFIDGKLSGSGHIRYDELTGKYVAAFTIYNQAASGGVLDFRLWDASEGKEYRFYNTEFSFQKGTSVGNRLEPVIIKPNEIFQSILLNKGINWFSFNVSSSDLSLQHVLKDWPAQDGDVIKSQFGFSQYSRENGWTGTLDVLSPETGYRIRSITGGELITVGSPASLWVTPAQLESGWNWVGYLPEKSLALEDALQFMQAVPGDKIKSQSQSAVYNNNGEWLGTLNEMQPGQSYSIYTQAITELIYPDLKKETGENESRTAKVDVHAFESNMTVTLVFNFDGADYGDTTLVVSAFVDGQLRGVASPHYVAYLDRFITFLMIYGDPQTNGEPVQLQLYNPEDDKTRDVSQYLVFEADGHSGNLQEPLLLNALQTDDERIPAHFYLRQNYPNPFNPLTTIEYGLPKDARVSVTIYNILGQNVSVLVNGKKQAGRYKVQFDAVSLGLASGVYFYQIRSGAYIKSYKMLLLK